MLSRQLAAVAVCAIALSPKLADACSCARSSLPCDEAGRADAVFVGHVVSIESSGMDGRVEFAVVEAFGGLQFWQVALRGGPGGGAGCGYPFQMGESYLVYAYRTPDGQLSTSICARTRPVAEATEDLTYLRALSKIAPGTPGRVAGRVQLYEPWLDKPGPPKPIPGVTVTATGGGRTFTGRANDRGEFELTGLPRGKYEVIARAPEGYESIVRPVTLNDPRGCGTTLLLVRYDGRVIGRVVDSLGRAMEGVPLELIAAPDLDLPRTYRRVSAWTAADGTFEMRLVPPGEYMLSLGLFRYRQGQVGAQRVLYPGVAGSSGASSITVSTAARVQLENFVMPGNLSLVTVRGIVVDEAGRPVRDAGVVLRRSGRDETIVWTFVTGEDGRFALTIPEGSGYGLQVTRYASPNVEGLVGMLPFSAVAGTPPLTVVMKPRDY